MIQFDVPPHVLDFTQKIIFSSDISCGLLSVALSNSSCRARYLLLYLNLVIVLATPLRLLRVDLYNFLQCGLCEQAHCYP